MPNLDPGQRVHIQRPTGHGHRQWDSQGKIISVEDDGRKYLVEYENGSRKRVNRIRLKKDYAESENNESDSDSDVDADSAPFIQPNSCSDDDANLGEDQGVTGSDSGDESEEHEPAAEDPAPVPPLAPVPAPAPAPEPQLRRSTRTGRGNKNPHQSCSGCHKIQCSNSNVRFPEPQSWAKHHPADRSPSPNQPPRPASGNIRARASSR